LSGFTAKKTVNLYLSSRMSKDLLTLSYTLETIGDAARRFWEAFNGYHIFAFSGEMGAGKTTFIHYLCDHLKVEDVVSSPTFALINEYHFSGAEGTDNTIFHLDWYRLRDCAEAIDAGMEDCIEQAQAGAAYCFIEWPEKATELLNFPYLFIAIDAVSVTERIMTITLIA
jgi:tRNA threonylcarbamoyladenosine biosynthesis protein TsaE